MEHDARTTRRARHRVRRADRSRAPRLDGRTHVNLTVRDLDNSTRWYCEVFGFAVVNDVSPAGSGFRFRTLIEGRSMSSVVLGQPEVAPAALFDEHSAGLHHLAFHVEQRAELDAWKSHLDDLGVENSGVTDSPHEAGS